MPPFGAPLTTTIFTSVGSSASVTVAVVSVVVVVCSVVVVSVDDALSESFEPQPTRATDATVDAAMSTILFTDLLSSSAPHVGAWVSGAGAEWAAPWTTGSAIRARRRDPGRSRRAGTPAAIGGERACA